MPGPHESFHTSKPPDVSRRSRVLFGSNLPRPPPNHPPPAPTSPPPPLPPRPRIPSLTRSLARACARSLSAKIAAAAVTAAKRSSRPGRPVPGRRCGHEGAVVSAGRRGGAALVQEGGVLHAALPVKGREGRLAFLPRARGWATATDGMHGIRVVRAGPGATGEA